MGVTNIRQAGHFLERAGGGIDQVALIPEPLMRGVYLDPNPSSVEELDLYGHLLFTATTIPVQLLVASQPRNTDRSQSTFDGS